jgi:hypothetical protein
MGIIRTTQNYSKDSKYTWSYRGWVRLADLTTKRLSDQSQFFLEIDSNIFYGELNIDSNKYKASLDQKSTVLLFLSYLDLQNEVIQQKIK